MREVFVVGAEVSKVGRHFELSYVDLSHEVASRLLNSLDVAEVDYLVISNVFADSVLDQLDLSSVVAQRLGLIKLPSVRVESGESSGLAALEHAVALVRSGLADCVLLLGVEKLTEYPTWVANRLVNKVLDFELEFIKGVSHPSLAAIIMKHYMRRYGVSREEIAEWAVKMHENATRIPHAQLPFRTSVDKVLNSMLVSEPIRLFDMFPLGDGAAALLLSSQKALKKLNSEAIKVREVKSVTSYPLTLRSELCEFPGVNYLRSTLSNLDTSEAVMEIHDSYTIYGILILENLGLAPKGKGIKALQELNINLSGGLKATGHPIGATGVYQIAEVYKFMTSGINGVKFNGKYGVIHSMSGPDYNSRLAILEKVM